MGVVFFQQHCQHRGWRISCLLCQTCKVLGTSSPNHVLENWSQDNWKGVATQAVSCFLTALGWISNTFFDWLAAWNPMDHHHQNIHRFFSTVARKEIKILLRFFFKRNLPSTQLPHIFWRSVFHPISGVRLKHLFPANFFTANGELVVWDSERIPFPKGSRQGGVSLESQN